jgi:hypothetical protein
MWEMSESASQALDTRVMTRLRQVFLAMTGLSAAMADALILVRPELTPEKLPAGLAWIGLAFVLLVPVSLVDRLAFFKTKPRPVLFVGPLVLAASILLPSLMLLGIWPILGIGFLAFLALIDSILACWQRLGIAFFWMWALVLVVLGVVLAAIMPVPDSGGPLTGWLIGFASNPWIKPGADLSAEAIGHMVLGLPFLAASLGFGGLLIGDHFREQSSTPIAVFVAAIFLALILPLLGFGAGALASGAQLTAFAVLGFGLPPLFVLASRAKDEPARFSPVVWAYALGLVPLLAILSSVAGLVWVIVLTAWILDCLGARNKVAWAMIAGAWLVWLGLEGWIGRWAVIDGAEPLTLSGLVGLGAPDRLAAMFGPVFAVIAVSMFSLIGQRRNSPEPRRLEILCLAILLVAALAPPLFLSLPADIFRQCLDVLYWAMAPFLLAEILTLFPKPTAIKRQPVSAQIKYA